LGIAESLDAIAFNYPALANEEHINIAYRLESNEYQSIKKLQLVILHLEEVGIEKTS